MEIGQNLVRATSRARPLECHSCESERLVRKKISWPSLPSYRGYPHLCLHYRSICTNCGLESCVDYMHFADCRDKNLEIGFEIRSIYQEETARSLCDLGRFNRHREASPWGSSLLIHDSRRRVKLANAQPGRALLPSSGRSPE